MQNYRQQARSNKAPGERELLGASKHARGVQHLRSLSAVTSPKPSVPFFVLCSESIPCSLQSREHLLAPPGFALSLSLSLAVSPFIHIAKSCSLSLCLFLSLCLCLRLSLSLCLSCCLSLSLSLSLAHSLTHALLLLLTLALLLASLPHFCLTSSQLPPFPNDASNKICTLDPAASQNPQREDLVTDFEHKNSSAFRRAQKTRSSTCLPLLLAESPLAGLSMRKLRCNSTPRLWQVRATRYSSK